jgi:hypothetical protein
MLLLRLLLVVVVLLRRLHTTPARPLLRQPLAWRRHRRGTG